MKPVMTIDIGGNKRWRLNGKFHREDGPAIEYADGTKHWYINDERHREDGPAVERADGLKQWWVNGELHREDGAAIELPNGVAYWYINNTHIDLEEIIKNYPDGYGPWTAIDIVKLKLKYL